MNQIYFLIVDLFRHSFKGLFAWQAEHCDLLNKLTTFSLAREKRTHGHELGEDAPDGPDVDLIGVVGAAKRQFGCAIVPTHDVRCVKLFGIHDFGRPEIANLNDSVLGQQNIFRLQISMTNIKRVHMHHAFQYLLHVVLDVGHGDGFLFCLCFLDHIFQVAGAVLKHQILHFFAFFVATVEDVEHLDAMFVSTEFFENFKFA